MSEKKDKTFFPRPDETLSEEEGILQTARELLLWMAKQEEKIGHHENAERLKAEAQKAITQ